MKEKTAPKWMLVWMYVWHLYFTVYTSCTMLKSVFDFLQVVHSKFQDLVPKTMREGDPELERPDDDAVREVSLYFILDAQVVEPTLFKWTFYSILQVYQKFAQPRFVFQNLKLM